MKDLKPKNRGEPKLANIPIRILFHFCKHHFDQLLGLRAWLATRTLCANQGNWADTTQVMKVVKIKQFKLFKRKLMRSGLFRYVSKQKMFPVSAIRIMNKHRLRYGRTIIRTERANTIFLKNLSSNKKLSAYITKIYFENDLRKKPKYRRITYGRISQSRASEALNLCVTTIRDNLRVAKAKKEKNIRFYKHLKINEKFGQWLFHNDEIMPDKQIGKEIHEDFYKYFECKTPHGHYLAARYPDIFYFTGYALRVVSRRPPNQHHCQTSKC